MTYEQKESIGKLFRGYMNIVGNPQSQYRKEAAIEISDALDELLSGGVSFDEVVIDGAVKRLLMLTDEGMKRFIDFIHGFMKNGYDDEQSMSDIVDEQVRIAKWVKEHKKELIV